MRAFRILDLAEVLIEHSGRNDVKVVEIGIRQGEKLEEVLVAEGERAHTFQLDEDLLLIKPNINSTRLQSYVEINEHQLLTKDEIKTMLEKAKLL